MRIKFDISGNQQVDLTMSRFQGRAQDMRPAFDEMADSFEEWMTRQFDTEGSYTTGRWSPLSPPYAKWKAKNYPGQGILQRTGRLFRQLTMQPFGVDVREPRYAIFGTALPYANYHQQGGQNARYLARLQRDLRPGTRVGGVKLTRKERITRVETGSAGYGLPRREIIKMPATIRTSWRKIIQKHLVNGDTR